MTNFSPTAVVENGVLRLQFLEAEPTHSLDIECVVDMTDFDDVIGVEILDLTRQLAGGVVESSSLEGGVRWSYDDEVDAMYVHVREGRSQVQRRASGIGELDSEGKLVGLTVPLAGND